MNLPDFASMKMLLLTAALLLAGCAGTNPAASSADRDGSEIVDNGYQIKGAKHANQSNIMVEENRDRPSNLSLDMMLQQLPGVRITSGQGAYAQFTVDGTSGSFMSDTSPLFVVNGMAIGTDFSIVNAMVNPNEVSSLSVLKGSDATIYGSRGANGVILIRTKKIR
jgi:TonB-dependent SusC/RagA subfamily outer membrane receptor